MKRRQQSLSVEVKEIGSQIELWRSSREKQSAMPSELWTAAAQLAQRYGINPVARALRLSYDSLKRHVLDLDGSRKAQSAGAIGFVELDQFKFGPASDCGVVEVDVCDRDGQRMTIRLTGRSDVDVTSMVSAFWRRGG